MFYSLLELTLSKYYSSGIDYSQVVAKFNQEFTAIHV